MKDHIDVEIQENVDGNKWRMIGFYGSPDMRFRSGTWDLLRVSGQDQDLFWLVCGDFNETLYSFENKGGAF